jgi:ribose 5-phosphate isomerase B
MTTGQKIGLASDHAGFELKAFVKEYLDEKGYAYEDYGCFDEQSCDYPDFAHKLGNAIDNGSVSTGIAICGSGEGISMTLNKHQSVRAALVWIPEIAHMTRLHNDANVLVMPGRYINKEEARAIMDEFFSTDFEGGRHLRRVEKIPLK